MQFRLGPWTVRPEMDSIFRDGRAHHISPKAMEVLVCLAKHQGQVVSKEDIFSHVWKETFVTDDSLTRCVGELRRALQDGNGEGPVIQTISKRGYLLLPPIVWDSTDSAPAASSLVVAAGGQTQSSMGSEGEASPRNFQTQGPRRVLWLLGAVAVTVLVLVIVRVVRNESARSVRMPHVIRSLAVLPLANLSKDSEQEFFSDGMTDQLITELAQLGACDVISRTSVMRYKGTTKTIREIARELSVDAVIEGTVLRSGNRVRITVQLIDAESDKHLWSESFERELTDVLSLQGDIARRIAGELDLKLNARSPRGSAVASKVVPKAYEAYLRGWYLFDRGQYEKAANYFEEATIADPSFALGYALLWESDAMSSFVRDIPLTERALKAMEKARRLDENLAEVRDAIGDGYLVANWDWKAAENEFRRAIELDPGSMDAALHYIYCLHELRRWPEAEQQLKRALRLDPVSPALNAEMLRLLVDTHQHELAQAQFLKVLELNPSSGSAYDEMVTVYLALGREGDAVAAFLKAETLYGESVGHIKELESAGRKSGLRGCLRRKIEQVREEAKRSRVSPITLARLNARLGSKDEALGFLEQGFQKHVGSMIWINARAVWDPLRSDPRFQSMLRGMNFPE